jgi:hypothetical protein
MVGFHWPVNIFGPCDGISLNITSYIVRGFMFTSMACAIGPSVNPLQNRETQDVNIVLQCMYRYFEQPNMKGNHA